MKEMKTISLYSPLKYVSHVTLTLLVFAAFHYLHASYCIGSDPVGLERTPSFVEANLPLSLDQGKHRASFLYRVFALQYLHYIHDCVLTYRSSMEP
jgi:hypothetical protein